MIENNSLLEQSEGGKSNVSRNLEGKFTATGGEKIGEQNFVKRGFNKGKQVWKCISCTKRTTLPVTHIC
jgi:hypothetical protein